MPLSTALLPLVLAAVATTAPAPAPKIDWPAFLARHDLIWKRLPTKWEEGAFLGNGLIGAMVFATEDEGRQALAFQLGRTDVTDHRTGVEPMLAAPAAAHRAADAVPGREAGAPSARTRGGCRCGTRSGRAGCARTRGRSSCAATSTPSSR